LSGITLTNSKTVEKK